MEITLLGWRLQLSRVTKFSVLKPCHPDLMDPMDMYHLAWVIDKHIKSSNPNWTSLKIPRIKAIHRIGKNNGWNGDTKPSWGLREAMHWVERVYQHNGSSDPFQPIPVEYWSQWPVWAIDLRRRVLGAIPRWLFKPLTRGNTWWEFEILCWILMWRHSTPFVADAKQARIWRNTSWDHDLPKWMKRAGRWIKAWRAHR